MESAYIIYDRKLDSEFEIEQTTEVIQDSSGHNAYIDGSGVIINGAENKENNQIKR